MNFSDSGTAPIKILVVDDYPNAAALLARLLVQLDSRVEVVSATGPLQALECVQDHAADIVITDMDMPEMTGLELIEKLQGAPGGGSIISILVTASYATELKIRAYELNVKEIFHKPVHPERISQVISRMLKEMDKELA